MLGTRSAGELARGTLILEATRRVALVSALRTRCEAGTAARTTWSAGTTLAAAIEDRTAALDAGIWTSRSRSSGGRRWRRSLVDGTRPSLRHNDFARLNDGRRRRNGHGFRRRCFRNKFRDGGRRRGHNWLHAVAGCSMDRGFRNRSGRRLGDSDSRWRSYNFGRFDDWSRLDFRFRNHRLGRRRDSSSGRSNDRRRNCGRWSWGHGRLDHHGNRRRRNRDGRTSSRGAGRRTRRRTGNDWPCRRTRGNSRSRRGRRDMHNRRSLTRLRNNLARLWPGSNWRRRDESRRNWRCGTSGSGCLAGALSGTRCGSRRTHHHGRRRGGRTLRVLRRALRFLLARQNRLHHIARLGDIREVDLGAVVLLGTRTRRGRRPGPAFKIVTHAHSFALLDRTRVGLAVRQIHMFQCVENLFTLDFQLTRQIVNSNLTQSASFRCPALCRLTGHSNLAAR